MRHAIAAAVACVSVGPGPALAASDPLDPWSFGRRYPWAAQLVVRMDSSRASSAAALEQLAQNLDRALLELREYTDESDDLATAGLLRSLEIVAVSYVPADGWHDLDARRGALLLRVPVRHALTTRHLDALAASFAEPYRGVLERYYDVRISVGMSRGCRHGRARAPTALELGAALRQIDLGLRKYPPEALARLGVRFAVVSGLEDGNGGYGGMALPRCALLDARLGHVEEILHHELGHHVHLRAHARWRFEGPYLHRWNYKQLDQNPTEVLPGFVSAYARKNSYEDFAETAEAMLMRCPELLERASREPALEAKVLRVAGDYARLVKGRSAAREWLVTLCGQDPRAIGGGPPGTSRRGLLGGQRR